MKKVKVPFRQEGVELTHKMIQAKLSPREVAQKTGRPESHIRAMMAGRVKPPKYYLTMMEPYISHGR